MRIEQPSRAGRLTGVNAGAARRAEYDIVRRNPASMRETDMEFHITGLPVSDVTAIDDAIRAVDPAALVDVEGMTVRVATCLGSRELTEIISITGNPVGADQIVQLPSVCCGGCSG